MDETATQPARPLHITWLVVFALLCGLGCSEKSPQRTDSSTDDALAPDADDSSDAGPSIISVGSLLVLPGANTVSEDGTEVSFTLMLDDLPRVDTEIAIVSSKPEEGAVNINSITWPGGELPRPWEVRVIGVDDLVKDGDQPFSVEMTFVSGGSGTARLDFINVDNEVCGNEQVNVDEDCDVGDQATDLCEYGETSCEVCNAQCRLVAGDTAWCGDGEVTRHETCDIALDYSCDVRDPECGFCDDCQLQSVSRRCGNGVVDPGELCDIGLPVTHTCAELGLQGVAECGLTCQTIAGCRPAPIVELAAGRDAFCGRRGDGTVSCWGDLDALELPYTTSAQQVTDACILDVNGEISCRLGTPPAGSFMHISTAAGDGCGVGTDGSITCWGFAAGREPKGSNYGYVAMGGMNVCAINASAPGEPGPIACSTPFIADPPAGDFVEMVVATRFGCALAADGTITCWDAIEQPPPGTYRRLGAYDNMAVALTTAGEIVLWGGALPAPEGTFEHLAIADSVVCGVTLAGEVRCTGVSSTGADQAREEVYVKVDVNREGCALTSDAALDCWGYYGISRVPGAFRSFAVDTDGPYTIGTQNELVHYDIFDIDLGILIHEFSVAALDVVKYGQELAFIDGEGRLVYPRYDPDRAYDNARYVAISMDGTETACGLAEDGEVYCPTADTLHAFGTPPAGPYLDLSAAGGTVCAIRIDGTLECWGASSGGAPVGEQVLDVSLYSTSAGCVVRQDGTLQCWDETGPQPSPRGVFRAVTASPFQTCALTVAGQVHCWGDSAKIP